MAADRHPSASNECDSTSAKHRTTAGAIHVVRAFVQLRDLLTSNKELAQKFAELERKVSTHDQAIVGILKAIRELMSLPQTEKRPIGFVELQEKK